MPLPSPLVSARREPVHSDGNGSWIITRLQQLPCLAVSSLSPDVESIYRADGEDKAGMLDFFVDKLGWVIELLWEGPKSPGHEQRFNRQTGRYKDIHIKK